MTKLSRNGVKSHGTAPRAALGRGKAAAVQDAIADSGDQTRRIEKARPE